MSLPGQEVRSKKIELRKTRNEDGSESKKIGGYAIVWDEETNIGNVFRETFRRGAFASVVKEKRDVRALYNHDDGIVLGRTASGTMQIEEDDVGLRFEIDLPDTQHGRDVAVLVDRGDITGVSVRFAAIKDQWSGDDPGDLELREVEEADLYELSPLAFPQYQQTSVERRSVKEVYNTYKEKQELRDDGAQEREEMRLRIDLLELEGE